MTSISLPGASGRCFVRSVFTCWACVAVANPKVKINTERMSFFMVMHRFCPFGDVLRYPMERTQNQKRSLGNALSILKSRLLFGRETHASTTQSDPLLLPTRNGPCREDGALHWEYLFYRVQHPPP